MKLRSYLVILILAALVPPLVFSGIVITMVTRHQRAASEAGLRQTARALSLAVDRELERSISTLEALATSEALDAGRLDRFVRQSERVLATQDGWATLTLADRGGRSLVDAGASPAGRGRRVIDSALAAEVVATPAPRVSDFLGSDAGDGSIAIMAPVARLGTVHYVLAAHVSMAALSRILIEQRIVAPWTAVIHDRRGIAIARTLDADSAVGKAVSRQLAAASRQDAEGSFAAHTRHGVPVYTSFSRSPLTGWTVAISAPAAVLDAPARRLLWAVAAGAVGFAAVGLGLAAMVARRIASPITSLANAAPALATGDAVRPAPAKVAEVENLARAIERASLERRRVDEVLRTREAELAEFFEHAPVGVEWIAADGRIERANRTQLDLLGYAREDYVGRAVADFHADPEVAADLLRRVRRGDTLHSYEARLHARDGTVRDVLIDSNSHWAGGRFVYARSFTRDITGRKKVEEALRETEAWIRGLAESNLIGVVVGDFEGRVFDANDVFLRMIDGTRAELTDGTVRWDTPEYADRDARAVAEMRATGACAPYEKEFIARDGRRVAVLIGFAVLRTSAHRSIGYVLDLSEHKRLQRRVEFLAEASIVLSSSLDYETTLRTVARLAVPTVGDWCAVDVLAEDGSIQRLALAHLDPEWERFGRDLQARHPLHPEARHGVPEVLRSGKPVFFPEFPDWWLTAAAGDETELAALRSLGMRSMMIVPLVARGHILGAITFITAESGRVYRDDDLGFAEDLARRAALAADNAWLYREADQRRREAEELARLAGMLTEDLDPAQIARRIVEQIPPLFGADFSRLRLLEADGFLRALAWSGPTPDYAEPHNPLPPGLGAAGRAVTEGGPVRSADVLNDPSIDCDDEIRACLADSEACAIVSVPLQAKGRIIGALSLGARTGRAFSDAEVALLQTFANEAALALENARLYQEAAAARARAEGANRVKDEFLATVSHELRTPLTSIFGYARLLRSGRLDAAAAARAVEAVERNARSQVQLIEDLLDVSRIITGKLNLNLRSVNPVLVIEAALETLRPAADAKALRLRRILDHDAGTVIGDPDRLQQVVWNLLSNAVKFTPNGGRVTVRLERGAGEVVVVVTDTGRGIRADFLPHIFERFTQAESPTTRSYGGLGLGLAIARHLVELHGGTVEATSAGEGRGASFAVRLPAVKAPEDAPFGAEPPAGAAWTLGDRAAYQPPAMLTGTRVLVVDDEADTLALIATVLEQSRAEVVGVGSAREALRAMRRFRPHVLVSDLGLPQEDGYQLIRKVRALGPEAGGRIPAVALTAYARAADRERALSAGFQLHLPKPVEPGELVRVIALLAGRH